jgi:hypothetical protein
MQLNRLFLALIMTGAVSGCTKPRQTTAVGSGVGGVIGAGLGAIIGNQSGNAGSGVAIGAGAGAAVGALVGNALQAQEERNATQDEALKRQERVIQAQKNEIQELRSVRGDDSFAYSRSATSSARYRYKDTATNPESPEVAKQRAKLQQRGPAPKGSTGAVRSISYYSFARPEVKKTQKTPAAALPTAALPAATLPRTALPRTTLPSTALPSTTLPSTTTPSRSETVTKPLARYDVRSDLSSGITEKDLAAGKPSVESVAKSTASTVAAKETPTPQATPALKSSASDAPPSTVKPATITQSKECKEALHERDLAAEANENSDKLFHLRRSLRLCPQSAPLHHELGKVYASMQRSKDAEDEFKQALSIDPSFSAAKKELGALLKDEIQF